MNTPTSLHPDPDLYASLLAEKVDRLSADFAELGITPSCVVASPTTGFRLRAEFRIWHQGSTVNYVMFDPADRKTPIVIDDFPIVATPIRKLMPELRERLAEEPRLRRKLFQVEFLSTLSGDLLVTLIYHRALDDDWQDAAECLAKAIRCNIVGRSRKQKRVIGNDWVDECLSINGREWHYRQPEQAFTQPNGTINQSMIAWALAQAGSSPHDLLELYCGIGNFTLPLSRCFDRVIATELSKVATRAAEHNRQRNHIDNVEFARLSAEEMTEALAGTRPFRRLSHLQWPLSDYHLDTLLVDPPRAGLDAATLHLASGFERILYVSCNPTSLRANLRQLMTTHHINDLTFFDQFPYTHHMECGVLLTKIS